MTPIIELRETARDNSYASAALDQLDHTGCVVVKWRTGLSGTAWVHSDDWTIAAPKPLRPESFMVFAHEIGHHVLHRRDSNRVGRTPRPQRWEQEIEADEYAVACFHEYALPGLDEAIWRLRGHLAHGLAKSLRRTPNPEQRLPVIEQRLRAGTMAGVLEGARDLATFLRWHTRWQ